MGLKGKTIAQWVKEQLWVSAPAAPGVMPPPLPTPPPLPRTDDEAETFNPLGLRNGQAFAIAYPDYLDLEFTVEEIQSYTNRIGAETFRFVAYCAVARPERKEPAVIQLRVEDSKGADCDGGRRLQAVVLRLEDEFAYNEGFYNVVAVDDTGRFQITDDDTGKVKAEYFRPEGLHKPFAPTVVTIKGEAGQTTTRRLQYWDYWRKATDNIGGECDECLIVEMEESGWFRILVGPQIDVSRVAVI